MDNREIVKLAKSAAQLRKHIITMNCYASTGYPGGSLSSVEIVTYLFAEEINFSPENAQDIVRDRFVLSKGHSCLALYAALAQKGFSALRNLKKLRHVGGMLQGHPDRLKTPDVEFNSRGCALGGKYRKSVWILNYAER